MTLSRIALLAAVGATLLAAAAAAVGGALRDARGALPPEPVRPALVVTSPAGLALVLPGAGGPIPLAGTRPGDTAPALSPDGLRVAFERAGLGRGEIVVLDLWTGTSRRLTVNPRAIDTSPAWSPDGGRIAWASGRPGDLDLYVMDADGRGKRPLVRREGNDVEPDWSPDGRRLVFASTFERARYDLWTVDGEGGEPSPLPQRPGDQRDPAWSPGGYRIAFTTVDRGNADVWLVSSAGRGARRLTRQRGFDGRPAWSPDASRLAFLSGRDGGAAVWSVGADGSTARRLTGARAGAELSWGIAAPGPRALPGETLPDFDQRAPRGLVVTTSGGRVRLGFDSAADNVGTGPAWIRGVREVGASDMRADQLVELQGGGIRTYREVGVLRYTPHPPHYHWHYRPFERYELRRPTDYALLARDRKSGFCLADHYGQAAARVGGLRPPRFLGDCGKSRPELRSVEQGSSPGYTDRYPAFFHGQDIDITGLPAGLYVLVHRVNPERLLHELRYDNNAASALIRLSRPVSPGALPEVAVLRLCEGSERCPPSGA